MPGICIKITFEPGEGMKKAFEKLSAAIKNDHALEASFRAAAESMKAFTAAIPVLKGPVVDGHLRRALKYEQEKIDCDDTKENLVRKLAENYQDFMSGKYWRSRKYFSGRRQMMDINHMDNCLNCDKKIIFFPEDTCRSGQGIVFRSIGRWFFPGREQRDAWLDPGRGRTGYSRGWFRGRTAKSLKSPRRFKGWKGSR